MIIQTKFLGEVDINDDAVITFCEGLMGLEEYKKYVLLDMSEDGTFRCLQSVEEKYIAFIIITPWSIFPDYEIDVDDDIIGQLGEKDMNNLLVYNLVTVYEKGTTANLLAPLVINTKTLLGKQVVLYKSSYTTKHIIKEFVKKV